MERLVAWSLAAILVAGVVIGLIGGPIDAEQRERAISGALNGSGSLGMVRE